MTESGMTALLTALGELFTKVATNIASIAGIYTTSGNEILLLPLAMLFVGFFVGLFKRLVRIF